MLISLKRLLLLIGIITFLNACRKADQAESQQKIGTLDIKPQKLYFGSVNQGMIIPFRVHVTNSENQPITITDIQRTCGCTKAEMQTTKLPPGASTELTGTLNSSGRVGDFGSKVTLLGTDSTGSPILANIYLGARSVVPIEVWPYDLDLTPEVGHFKSVVLSDC